MVYGKKLPQPWSHTHMRWSIQVVHVKVQVHALWFVQTLTVLNNYGMRLVESLSRITWNRKWQSLTGYNCWMHTTCTFCRTILYWQWCMLSQWPVEWFHALKAMFPAPQVKRSSVQFLICTCTSKHAQKLECTSHDGEGKYCYISHATNCV